MIGPTDPRYDWTRQRMLVEIEALSEEVERLKALSHTVSASTKQCKSSKNKLYKAQLLIAKALKDM